MRSLRLLAIVPLIALAACSGGDDDGADSNETTEMTADASTTAPTTAPTSAPTSAGDETGGGETTVAVTAPDETAPTTVAEPVVAAAALSPAEFAPLAAEVTVELDTPAQIRLVATTDGHEMTTPFTADANTSFALPLAGLYSDRSYEVAVHALVDGDEITLDTPEPLVFDTPPLPAWMPAHTVVSDPERVSPGYTYVESSPNQIETDNGSDDDAAADDAAADEGDGDGDAEDGAANDGGNDAGGAGQLYPRNLGIVYDESGEIVWFYTNQGLGGVEQTADGTFHSHYGPFGAREFDLLGNVVGHWRPSFAEGVGARTPGALPDGNPGDAAPITVGAPWTELRSFHHEVRPMGNGNLIGLSAALHDLTPEQREAICPGDELEFKAVSDVIVEFTPEGEVLRTWDLWDVVDIVEVPGSDMCFVDGGLFASDINRDWTHANSVIYDETRDAIVISARHTDQIIALDHLDEEGPQSQLRWIIGAGGTIPFDGDLPYHQHAVELMDNGDYIFYDNGNARPGTNPDDPENLPYSRAAIYSVDDSSDDPADWSATQVWEHIDVEDDGTPVFTSFISDADILANGNVLITHGGIGPFPPSPEFPLRALVVEVVKGGGDEGDIVWRLDSDPFQSHTVYRSEKLESFYVGDQWATVP